MNPMCVPRYTEAIGQLSSQYLVCLSNHQNNINEAGILSSLFMDAITGIYIYFFFILDLNSLSVAAMTVELSLYP